MTAVRIGTRTSQLALWQANHVKLALLDHYPDLDVELVEMVSEGDRTLDIPLHQAGGKGLFLKELEVALCEERIDLAVHSMKDVTITLPEGLHIPVMCARGDPRDAWVSNRFPSLEALPEGAVVGTCSLRRRCQIQARYPHLVLENLRGNVNTRLAKLDAGAFDGIVLAAAGLKRLGMRERISQLIAPDICLPAVGQGVVGIECRVDDGKINALIEPLCDRDALIQVATERAANAVLDGGCHAPVAVYSEILEEGTQRGLRVRARIGELDGSRMLASERTGPFVADNDLGRQVAQDLLDQGAAAIIERIHACSDPVRLDGLRVLVPRPSPQGDRLISEIRALGGQATHFPVLKTIEPEHFRPLDRVLGDIGSYALFIVVSVAAANALSARMRQLGVALSGTTKVASVGPVTSSVLEQLGIPVDFEPQGNYSSEGLLEQLETTGWAGKKVAVFRGQDGRELLSRELRQRGACVEMICSYRRVVTDAPFDPVLRIWRKEGFDAVIITSNAILDALLLLLGQSGLHLMDNVTSVAISQRIKDYCVRLGINGVSLAAPGNQPVIQALAMLREH